MSKTSTLTLTAVAAVLAGLAAPAQADLVLVGPEDFQGTGLGSVNTILTIQSPGSTSFETGSVGRALSNPNDVITGNALTGASQTQTRTVDELGLTTAANLRVVFNALEPGGPGNSVLLSDLELSIFSHTGALLFASGDFSCPTVPGCNFPNTLTGAGNSGFVFALTPLQQAAAAGALANPLNRVGLSATVNNATSGFETFFVANSGSTVTPIPEPETYALMLAGLAAVGFVANRRRRTA